MKNNLILILLVAIFLSSLLGSNLVSAQENQTNQTNLINQINQTNEANETEIYESLTVILIEPKYSLSGNGTQAFMCLKDSQIIIQELVDNDFNAMRPNDIFMIAKQLFDAQVALDKEKGKANYDEILSRCDEINEIQLNAYDSYDQLNVLEAEINISSKRMNISEAIVLFERTKEAFNDERYEDCLDLIEETYDKISEIESSTTIFTTFYNATRRTLATIFIKNWIPITVFIICILLFYLIFNKQIKIYFLKRKKRLIELEKETILRLIGKVQNDYFEKGLLSETAYHIKLKKFSELVRDINRQIPLIEFELVKLRRRVREQRSTKKVKLQQDRLESKEIKKKENTKMKKIKTNNKVKLLSVPEYKEYKEFQKKEEKKLQKKIRIKKSKNLRINNKKKKKEEKKEKGRGKRKDEKTTRIQTK